MLKDAGLRPKPNVKENDDLTLRTLSSQTLQNRGLKSVLDIVVRVSGL